MNATIVPVFDFDRAPLMAGPAASFFREGSYGRSGMAEPKTRFKRDYAKASFRKRKACLQEPAARIIRSVVADAGLGRFLYLQGVSGRRYVFSTIQPAQAALYDNAVFVTTRLGGDVMRVSRCAKDMASADTLLHVHLLDDMEDDADGVFEDLMGA